MMQNAYIPEQAGTLNLLAQPVFYVREGQIVFRNSAAAALTNPREVQIGGLLAADDLEEYRRYDGQTVLELVLQMDGRQYSAVVHREQGGADVFVARAKPLYDALSLDTLAVVAQTIRSGLTELFDASSVLFPMLEEREDPKIQRQTARMNKGFYELLRLSSNLADVGRYMSGEARAFLERTELTAFFAGQYDRAASLCATLGVKLTYQCPSQPFYAAVDRQKLERAVLNLLANALRYTPRGGQIVLRVENFGHSVHIRMTDSGEGIAPADMATAFDHYEHREQLLGDPRWGVGLGLPLVRFIANLHGGTVIINSAPGGGTSVTMSLSRRLEPTPKEEVRSPVRNYDYAGGYDHMVLELADALPVEVFDTMNLH